MKIAKSYESFEVAEEIARLGDYWEIEHRCFQDYKDDADDLILLHWEVKYRVKQVIQTLLGESVSPKQRDSKWNTILHVAASWSHTFFIHVRHYIF
jgi:ankyrin repeat protein